MTVYVVTQGDYSSYHIVGVTLERQKAEKWIELYNDNLDRHYEEAQIEEFETDDFGANGLYLLEVEQDYGDIECRIAEREDDGMYWDYVTKDGEFHVRVLAKDRDHAIKAAYDKVAMLKAEKEGVG